MGAHQTADFDTRPADGWYSARCECGWTEGPFPDTETTVDALMEHAYEMGREEAPARQAAPVPSDEDI